MTHYRLTDKELHEIMNNKELNVSQENSIRGHKI